MDALGASIKPELLGYGDHLADGRPPRRVRPRTVIEEIGGPDALTRPRAMGLDLASFEQRPEIGRRDEQQVGRLPNRELTPLRIIGFRR